MQYLKDPKISIITVCLNSGDYLEDAIKSVSRQSYPNIEYIIVDGGSTDGSAGIFDKYKDRIDKIVTEKDNGIFDAMNKGIRLSGGDIIYFLNSDDRFFDDRVVLIAPREHPWASGESVAPQELIGQPFILREETAGTRRVMQAGLLEHGIRIHDLDVVMELGNAEAIESSVEAGIGIAFISRLVAKRCIQAGYVAEVPVEGLRLERELHMIRNSRRAQTRIQAAFWDFVHTPENETLLKMAA